jgi:hypothetical protein
MALDVRKFGPKSDKIGAHRGAFVYQEPFKKDSSTASRVINEVVLGSWVNKDMRKDRGIGASVQEVASCVVLLYCWGARPSCCSKPRLSYLSHSSTILPSSMRWMVMPSRSTCLPVGGPNSSISPW